MAFEKTVETVHGFQAVDAYHRVECVILEAKNKITFRVRSYKDDSGNYPAFDDKGFSCDYSIDGANPIAQAYGHLKTLPDYIDAKDH